MTKQLKSIHDLYYKCVNEFEKLNIGVEEDIIGVDNGILCIDFIKPKDKLWLTQDDRKNSLLYTYIDNDNLYYKPANNKVNRIILIKPTYDIVYDYLQIQFKHQILSLSSNTYDKYVNKIFVKNKSFNTFEIRNFTKDESEAYYKHLLKLFKPIGRKRFNNE